MQVRQKDYAFLVAFVSATFLSIVFMTVILPNMVFQPAMSSYVEAYTEQELRGREIYKREGCWYCHTQFVRPQDRNEGPVALAGDFEFHPETVKLAKEQGVQLVHLLGTERTGPDLSLIGGKMPDAWHKAHHANPQAFNPGSVMPKFNYLSEKDMDDLVAYVQTLGRKKNQAARDAMATYKGNYNEAYKTETAGGVSIGYLVEPEVPWEFKQFYEHEYKNQNPIKYENRYIAGARGIFNNKCAVCHGVEGNGQGPRALSLTERPANFQSNDPNMDYDSWSDIKWFWKISEGGGPGAVMPRWNGVLETDQIWYLAIYCRYLAADKTMPMPSRDEPLRDPALPGKTFHYEGDDLIVSYPAAPEGTPASDPSLTGEPVEQLTETPIEGGSEPTPASTAVEHGEIGAVSNEPEGVEPEHAPVEAPSEDPHAGHDH